MFQFRFSYKNSTVTCRVYGRGPKLVLAFHGYGESAAHFAFLERYTDTAYTLLAMDLPFHGDTDWQEGLIFTADDMQQLLFQAIDQLPASFSAPFTLLGFSLGGRVALRLYQSQPQLFSKLVLLAPDGLKVNPWYWLATQTWLGNRLFAFTMKRPGWFFFLLKGLNKLKLVNTSIYKFVQYYIGNEEVRLRLYQRWTALRKIKPALPRIKKEVLEQQTKIRLVYGKYDRIILPVRGSKFQKGIESYCTITVIEGGHQLLHERYVANIMAALKD